MLKRPFIIISTAFLLGVLSSVFDCVRLLLLLAVVFTVWIAFCKKQFLALAVTVLIFLSAGTVRMKIADYSRDETLRKFEGVFETVTFTVTEFSEKGKAVSKFSYDGKNYNAYLSLKNISDFEPGDIVKASVCFSRPYAGKVSLSGFSSYLAGRNVFLYASGTDGNITGKSKSVIYALRRYINSVGEKFFNADIRALFNAMVLGDNHLLSDELTVKLQKAGLNHIAVVSGMHLSIIIALQAAILGKLLGRRRIGHIISIVFAVFITLVTGAGASVVRALLMCIIYELSQLLYRENDSLTSLAITVFLMTFYNPFIIFNAGFVLSVSSVAGILLYYKKVQKLTGKFLKGYIRDAASVTISAQLTVTLPVICYFGIVTPYTLIANVLVSVFANMLVICGMLFCVLSKVPFVSGICAFIVRFLAESVMFVCDGISLIPGAMLETGNPSGVLIIVWAFSLFILNLKKPDRQKLIKTALVFAVAFSVVLSGKAYRESKIRMNFVPYGAKCMTTMFFPDGDSLIIDCHNYEDAKDIAARENTSSYTCAVLSDNYENDAGELIENGMADTVVASNDVFSPSQKKKLSEKLEGLGATLVFLKEGESYYCNHAYIRFISTGKDSNRKVIPEIEYMGKRFASLQNFSVRDTDGLIKNKIFIDSDFLKLPFLFPKDTKYLAALSDGKMLVNEKNISIKLK